MQSIAIDFLFVLRCVQRCSRAIVPALFWMISITAIAQEIPLGTWRAHISYNKIVAVDVSNQFVYAAAANGFMIMNRNDHSMVTYNKLNAGLSGVGITDIQYDEPTRQLVITFEDGKFDMIKDEKISSFDPTANGPITGSTKINHISVRESLAYLATDYGVVVVDLARNQVKETWRDLGALGSTLKIFQSTFKGDSIFLATGKGILAGDLDDNLLDFSSWKRFDTGELNAPVATVAFFNDLVYAGVNPVGIFQFKDGIWTKQSFLQGLTYTSLTSSSEYLYITESTNLWRLDVSDQLTQVADDEITRPIDVQEDAAGHMWFGDELNGLVSNNTGIFSHYLPDGPSMVTPFRLRYTGSAMYALPGGYSSTFQPLRRNGVLDRFATGTWQHEKLSIDDLTDISVTSTSDRYVSSFGNGIEKTKPNGDVTVFDESNSSLVNINPPGDFINISAMALSVQGLWIGNYGATTPLHRLSNETNWEPFSFGSTVSRYPLDLAVDFAGYVWMMLNPSQGGGVMVYDPVRGGQEYITEGVGTGGLPVKAVRSIAVDRDGLIWLGTELGVCYFFSPSEDAIRPIFENRFLLRDDKVTAIAIDGGNRKWMGTERGVWLFDPNCETLIYNFTAENSPLLSNVIHDIEINHDTGEVFFATSRGVVSFRSDATGSSGFSKIKIFPNPVLSTFTGTVGISGLAPDALVKITDISGKLIWETRANGGTASWNVKDYNGKRAATGIYIVYAATADGSDSAVGKIAVVN